MKEIKTWIEKRGFNTLEANLLLDLWGKIENPDDRFLAIEVGNTIIDEFSLKATSVAAYFTRLNGDDSSLKDPDIEKIRVGLAKIKKLKIERVVIKSENFRRLIIDSCGDIRVLLILMAEAITKLRNAHKYSEQECKLLLKLSRYLFLPFAHRLGLYKYKTELENIWMRYSYPEMYQTINKMIAASERAHNDFFRRFTSPLRKKLNSEGFKYSIKQRYKSVTSIWRKMQNKNVEFNEIFDLFAIRIILESTPEREKMECWQVYSIVSDQYKPDPKRLRDWLSSPRASGYESLHTTVNDGEDNWVEIQIRSEQMDEVAERGSAAHWHYKEKGGVGTIDSLLSSVRQKLEKTEQYDPESGNEVFKSPYDNDIFVLSPAGDVRMFHDGATVLDFAFDIHTSLGETCTGAKINGRIQPIRHKLQSGDEVEILTQKNQKPVSDWLSFVNSGKAKSGIRRALRLQIATQSEEGKATLFRKLRNWKIVYNEEDIEQLIRFFKEKTAVDFFHKIATEDIDIYSVRKYFQEKDLANLNLAPIEKQYKLESKSLDSEQDDILLIEQDAKNIQYNFARCCNPLPGDKVFGFVTVSKGIKIHRTTCPNARDMREHYAYRIIPVQWKQKNSYSAYRTIIHLSGIDREGLVNEISKLVSLDTNLNLVSISLNAKSGQFHGVLIVQITSKESSDNLLKKLKRVRGINSATRHQE